MTRRRLIPEPDPEPEDAPEEHVHDLVPHCSPPCRWVRCKTKTCGYYADLKSKRWAYR